MYIMYITFKVDKLSFKKVQLFKTVKMMEYKTKNTTQVCVRLFVDRSGNMYVGR